MAIFQPASALCKTYVTPALQFLSVALIPYLAKRFDRLKELARDREDPLSYAAASLEPGRSTPRHTAPGF
jgi:hypothetical protein